MKNSLRSSDNVLAKFNRGTAAPQHHRSVADAPANKAQAQDRRIEALAPTVLPAGCTSLSKGVASRGAPAAHAAAA
jgi:hypothetical protein